MGNVSLVTNGICVSVETLFREEHSDAARDYYYFSYFITISNLGKNSCRLLRRHWHIVDSCGEWREVEGVGVVGLQPVLHPGEEFSYESACHFTSEIGKMYGTFYMEDMDSRRIFEVQVPEFLMMAPARLN